MSVPDDMLSAGEIDEGWKKGAFLRLRGRGGKDIEALCWCRWVRCTNKLQVIKKKERWWRKYSVKARRLC